MDFMPYLVVPLAKLLEGCGQKEAYSSTTSFINTMMNRFLL